MGKQFPRKLPVLKNRKLLQIFEPKSDNWNKRIEGKYQPIGLKTDILQRYDRSLKEALCYFLRAV